MSKLVVFDNGMKGVDSAYASMTNVGELRVTGFHSEGNITLPANRSFLFTDSNIHWPGNANNINPTIRAYGWNGAVRFWYENSASQGGFIEANPFGFGTQWASDDNLKYDETPIANCINIVKQLKPRQYNMVNSLDDDPNTSEKIQQIGFIAQDVELIPELACLVGKKPDSKWPQNNKEIKTLNYNGIMTISVKALKELIEKVESLEERIIELENK